MILLVGDDLTVTDDAAIGGALTVTGAVDIDGAVQLDATLTVGANDQGYDVTCMEIRLLGMLFGIVVQTV